MLEHYGKRTGAWEATFSDDLANLQYAWLRQYDATFLNNTVGMLLPDPEVRANVVYFLKEGGGLAEYNAATHASIDWPEFNEIIVANFRWNNLPINWVRSYGKGGSATSTPIPRRAIRLAKSKTPTTDNSNEP
jgi:hypothetical protein